MGCCSSSDADEDIKPLLTQIDPSSTSHSSRHKRKLTKQEIEYLRIQAIKRSKAVEELIETEKTYVRRLKLLIDKVSIPLKNNNNNNSNNDDNKWNGLINDDDHHILFGDIRIIYSLNNTFLGDLKGRYYSRTWNNLASNIGDQFIKFTPYFKMYQSYMNNYTKAIELLGKLKKNKTFQLFCEYVQPKCENLQIQSLLILPIQRMPRYSLSLKEILKYTEPTHPDYNYLKNALKLVDETTKLLNKRMKEFEDRQKVKAIEERFNGIQLIKPARIFIFESKLTKIHKTGKLSEYTFILFSDILIYASQMTGMLQMKLNLKIPIDQAFYVDPDVQLNPNNSNNNNNNNNNNASKSDVNNGALSENKKYFKIFSGMKSFIVFANSIHIKKQWIKHLNSVIFDDVDKELSAPLMVPDNWSDNCQICDGKFSFYNRRHHCRYCGLLICSRCGPHKLGHKIHQNRIVKPICVACYDKYKDINPAPSDGVYVDDSQYDSDDANFTSSLNSIKTLSRRKSTKNDSINISKQISY